MKPTVSALISKSALQHNLKIVKQYARNKKIIAMVKANGYGHGVLEVARALENADAFGVARIDEAVLLKDNGIKNDIILIEGCFTGEELELALQYDFITLLHSPYQVDQLITISKNNKPIRIWMKLNAGMNRLGFSKQEFEQAYTKISAIKNIKIIGFMSHFPQAEEIDNPLTMQQYKSYLAVVGNKKGELSSSNSAAILKWPKTHGDWVRPGLMLYGASPITHIQAEDLNLKPVMTLQTKLITIRKVKQGEKVGYGGHWICSRQTSKIGIVAIGYGDGYPWHAKNGTPVLINGEKATLVGRVSMDMMAVDLSHITHPAVGDNVILWGENLPIEEIAKFSDTIPYELFCRLTSRVMMKTVD